MPTQINCPLENYPATVVLGTGTTGIISASGIATADRVTDEITVTDVYNRVYGLVYPGYFDLGSAGVPGTPAPGAVFVNQPGSGATQVWYLPKIPGAKCTQTGSGTLNTLVIWAVFLGTGNIVRCFRHFQGVCGKQTSCPPPYMGASLSFGGFERPPIVPLTTAPRVWQLDSGQFKDSGSEAFDGGWSLELRGTEQGVCSWESVGDAVTTALVRLSCESPVSAQWKLTFLLGTERLCYVRAAESWYLLSANVLVLAPDETSCSFTPPKTITVTPG